MSSEYFSDTDATSVYCSYMAPDAATNVKLSKWTTSDATREYWANKYNERVELLDSWIKRRCELVCELSYWIVGREFGADNPYAPKEGGSGCDTTCGNYVVITNENDERQSTLTQESFPQACDYMDCDFGKPPLIGEDLNRDDWPTEWGKFTKGLWLSQFRPYLCALDKKIQAIKNECLIIEIDIQYEKEQRRNLDELRERKGISDDDLRIIYGDREEAMMLVSPEGEYSKDREKEEKTQRNLYITAAVLAGIVGLGGLGFYLMNRGEQ